MKVKRQGVGWGVILVAVLGMIFSVMAMQPGIADKGVSKIANYKGVSAAEDPSPNGMFDPSIEYDAKGTGWMVYSGIEFPKYIHTNLARSTDGGKTWTFVKRLHTSKDAEVVVHGGKKQKGVWRHEVAALLHDPKDTGKEWKLFWHKYFIKPPFKPNQRMFNFGWIAYSHAPDPRGPWSEEVPLFGAGSYPMAPFKTKINLNQLHPDLKPFAFYSEPGVVVVDDVIYIAMEGSTNLKGKGEWRRRRTFLLASHDHGKTWKYVGRLTEFKDAERLGYVLLFSSSLARAGDKAYLFQVAAGAKGGKRHTGFDGVVALEFEDISKAKLKRDSDGHLIVHKRLMPSEVQGGPGDYDERNTYGGFVMGHIDMKKAPKVFQVVNTREQIGTTP